MRMSDWSSDVCSSDLDEIERMPGLEGAAIAVEQRARHCLIEARNARWLPVLERLLREGHCFVAVGAIHLTGDHCLLAHLRPRGFPVTVATWRPSGAPPQPPTPPTPPTPHTAPTK